MLLRYVTKSVMVVFNKMYMTCGHALNGEEVIVRRKLQWIISLVIYLCFIRRWEKTQNKEYLNMLCQKQEKVVLVFRSSPMIKNIICFLWDYRVPRVNKPFILEIWNPDFQQKSKMLGRFIQINKFWKTQKSFVEKGFNVWPRR